MTRLKRYRQIKIDEYWRISLKFFAIIIKLVLYFHFIRFGTNSKIILYDFLNRLMVEKHFKKETVFFTNTRFSMQILINLSFYLFNAFSPFSLFPTYLQFNFIIGRVQGARKWSVVRISFYFFLFFFSFLRIVPLYAGFPFIVNHVLIDTTARGLVHGKALIWNDPL